MKRTVLIIIAVCLAGLFAWLAINRTVLSLSTETRKSARTVIPSSDNSGNPNSGQAESPAEYDETKQQPLVILDADESFVQAISVDINKDGTQDQICALKKTSEPNIYLVPALQNPVTGEYMRLQAIRTGITQTRTLLFYCMDIIGDRSNALVCSGMTADNIQLLAVYLPTQEADGKTVFTAAADLRSDGTISVQEVARPDAYNLGLTGGESFPIITYSSDPDSPDTFNQIERVYRWDRGLKRYELASESRITGQKIESQMLRQLQGGNVNSFEDYLTGLWYIPSASPKEGSKYIYFDTPAKEIIFHNGSTEEVFIRESGSSRRYGAYLTTRNRSIESIRRLIDVELTGADEIRVNIQEDVRLKIGVASDWDGVYRKMGTSSGGQDGEGGLTTKKVQALLGSGRSEWVSNDGQSVSFQERSYTLTRPAGSDTGTFAIITVGGKPVFQFKPDRVGAKSSFYLVDADIKPLAAGERQSMTLTEVTVTMTGTNLAGSPPVVFIRKS
jgi:hypothetical protein